MATVATRTTGTGAFTVIAAAPLTPSLVAVIVAVPVETPDTIPLASTFAMETLDDVHVTVRPLIVAPEASLGVAVSVFVSPIASVADAGDTSTDFTTAGCGVGGGFVEGTEAGVSDPQAVKVIAAANAAATVVKRSRRRMVRVGVGGRVGLRYARTLRCATYHRLTDEPDVLSEDL
jgi:hypothetical protein